MPYRLLGRDRNITRMPLGGAPVDVHPLRSPAPTCAARYGGDCITRRPCRLCQSFDVCCPLAQEPAQVRSEEKAASDSADVPEGCGDLQPVCHARVLIGHGVEEVLVAQGREGAAGLFVNESSRTLVRGDATAHPPWHTEVMGAERDLVAELQRAPPVEGDGSFTTASERCSVDINIQFQIEDHGAGCSNLADDLDHLGHTPKPRPAPQGQALQAATSRRLPWKNDRGASAGSTSPRRVRPAQHHDDRDDDPDGQDP